MIPAYESSRYCLYSFLEFSAIFCYSSWSLIAKDQFLINLLFLGTLDWIMLFFIFNYVSSFILFSSLVGIVFSVIGKILGSPHEASFPSWTVFLA